ncbi:unnamed protein product [Protopolystoma xenopodis]|uniref:Uncharacterized protein n=1 Tax=Protopolystoma xenopodis TaxID=117903 RepID=A0A3S5BLI3_9PLAT|nr:unnamed protein product [Protopolystoma xenopodis]
MVKAMHIEFTRPFVTARPVPLPSDAAFVVVHSGIKSKKAVGNKFNHRVAECRLAARNHIPCLNGNVNPSGSLVFLPDLASR